MKALLKKSLQWSISIAVITLVLAAIFSIISTGLLDGVTWAIGMIIVLAIILIGIIFDIIGVAATAANEIPFHAMASEKVKGAKQAIVITRHADRVASFCNDVVGDVSGIVSGTASAIVVLELAIQLGSHEGSPLHYITSVIFTSVVAALTVGGKAFGKTFAIQHSTTIILRVGRLIYFVENKLHVNLTNRKK